MKDGDVEVFANTVLSFDLRYKDKEALLLMLDGNWYFSVNGERTYLAAGRMKWTKALGLALEKLSTTGKQHVLVL